MKFLGKMLVKLLVVNDFIDSEDKIEIIHDFNESFEKSKNSKNPIIKALNGFLSHPLGVLLSIYGYAKLGQMLRDLNRANDLDDMETEFQIAYQKQMFNKMLNKEE